MDWLKSESESLFRRIKKNPKNRIVIYFEDIIASRNSLDLTFLSKYVDLAVTFDQLDAAKYGLEYYPTFMSKLSEDENNILQLSDACFFGASKKRYSEIIRVFRYLTENEIACDFGISRLNKGEVIYPGMSEIKYLIPYKKYIQHIYKTNCIVELIQEGSSGYTLRTWEALLYGKKLLTNNPNILSAPFYNEAQFCYFSNPEDIDPNFVKNKDFKCPNTSCI